MLTGLFIGAIVGTVAGYSLCAIMVVGKMSEQEQCKRCGYK